MTGKKIHIKFIISKNGHKITGKKDDRYEPVKERKNRGLEDDIKNEPMVKKTIEFFDGSIVNVKGE